VDFEAVFLGNIIKAWLGIGSSKALKELLIRLREAVVDLVSRGPQCI
jgi:hypothetical protein